MIDGYVRIAAASPYVFVADCKKNADEMIRYIAEADKEDCRLLVFPELCITGYTCSDLFLQDALLKAALSALNDICEATKGRKVLTFVGMPLEVTGKLYNTAVALYDGDILGVVPKSVIPSHGEYSEGRYFSSMEDRHFDSDSQEVTILDRTVPFGSSLLFTSDAFPMKVAVEIGEDLWAPVSPSLYHTSAGADVIVNLGASAETAGRQDYIRSLVKTQSAKCICTYIYAAAGEGESTTDLVFAGRSLIAENGRILTESEGFKPEIIMTETDLELIRNERRKDSLYTPDGRDDYEEVWYGEEEKELPKLKLTRKIPQFPFIPEDETARDRRMAELIRIQTAGLKKRLSHINGHSAVIGISGGLDSTLALLITCEAFDALGIPRTGITAVTMPCFGTTDRTYNNALRMAKSLGTTVREVPIAKAVRQHFTDIGHDENVHNVAYENAQARERTQVLMDIANDIGGLVIGTGDLSELALGWATYNGDHMSMYGVNADIPKTLVRHIVAYFAKNADAELGKVLFDVLDTPVSPELLPPSEGKISQKTEDLVGPYELHDFFIYHMLRYGFAPSKIYRMAMTAFKGRYDKETVIHWLEKFLYRFFSQQYKRSCVPDGPKVGSVGTSPRGDLHMPSDACVSAWIADLAKIK